MQALRLDEPLTIDGQLTESAWQGDDAFDALVQRDPVEGSPPSQRTEVRVRYDDDALYVGARLHDTAPDSIVARLARRDASIGSDRFAVYLDPYHDRRSGYYFMVNVAGTVYDGTLSNDVDDDEQWDGVWEGRAHIDDQGWTAEMRIPWSQLRIRSVDQPVWGINFMREISRRREKDYAAYRPRKESGFVSRFPDLVGMERVATRSSIEVLPYVTARNERLTHEPGDPFNDGSRVRSAAGGDLRARVGAMTLNVTANPDFGQVEVDPAVVNLTDIESYFDDKRPFFVEGASTFEFGRQGAGDYWDFDWDDPQVFYSRRIGREPQGDVPSADYSDVPLATTILGAAKLVGRASPSWTVGTLQAVTDRETADLVEGDHSWSATVEPLTWYGVLRTQREFEGRKRGIGFIGTGTARSFDDRELRDQLNSQSVAAGMDGWAFLDPKRTWVVSGWTALSQVRGNQVRMIDVQRSSLHYFQRPDAAHVEVDSSATSLTGVGGRYWINKEKGAVMFNAGAGFVDPKVDVSDLGYQERSDVINGHVGTGYRWSRPTRWFTYQSLKGAVFGTVDYGSNPTKRGLQVSSYTEFQNGWTLSAYGTGSGQVYNNRRTRGGPLTLELPALYLGTDIQTDSQQSLFAYASVSGGTSKSGSWSVLFYPGVEWKPAATLSLRIGPGWERSYDDAARVASIADSAATATYGRSYVFSHLDQRTASASLRLNWTFRPTLSLQTYVQPFISSAHYWEFKTLVEPGTYSFAPTTYQDELDFTVRSLKGNAVVRWEYRPGSTLFLVWTQKRSSYESIDAFAVQPSRLVDVAPENVFQAKVTYYFTP